MKPTLGMIAFMAYNGSDQPPSEQEWRDRKDAERWKAAAAAVINECIETQSLLHEDLREYGTKRTGSGQKS